MRKELDHILHKKMPNFQICSSNKKILAKVDWQFVGYRKARSFPLLIAIFEISVFSNIGLDIVVRLFNISMLIRERLL